MSLQKLEREIILKMSRKKDCKIMLLCYNYRTLIRMDKRETTKKEIQITIQWNKNITTLA